MTEFDDFRAYEGEPDEFDLLISGLAEQMVDPYLVAQHREALDAERMVAESPEADTNSLRDKLVSFLDSKWRYMGKQIKITGPMYVSKPLEGGWAEEMVVDHEAMSRGFIFHRDTLPGAEDTAYRIAHLVEYRDDEGERTAGIALISHDVYIELPFPSPELRDQRFGYHHADDAALIDELAFTARREDQIIKDFAEYSYDANLDDPDEREVLADASHYLKARAELEEDLNYNISLLGPFILVDEDGMGRPGTLSMQHVSKMKIVDVVLRPADNEIDIHQFSGLQRCVPYVLAKMFDKRLDHDRLLYFPCSSIVWMSSDRYDVPKPPIF